MNFHLAKFQKETPLIDLIFSNARNDALKFQKIFLYLEKYLINKIHQRTNSTCKEPFDKSYNFPTPVSMGSVTISF